MMAKLRNSLAMVLFQMISGSKMGKSIHPNPKFTQMLLEVDASCVTGLQPTKKSTQQLKLF